ETAARALVARPRRDGAAGLDDVRGRGRVEQLVGRRVCGAGHLVAAVSVLWRVAVGPPRVDPDQVVRLGHHVDDRRAGVLELLARVAVGRRLLALVDRGCADETPARDGDD